MNIRKLKTILAAVLASLLLAGCQDGGDSEPAPTSVEERAQARWDAFVDRDFATAWEYYSPGYRQMRTQEVFVADKGGRPITWHAGDVVEKNCETDDKCEIVVEVTYQATGAPNELSQIELTREIREEWVRVNGQWWYLDN